MRLFAIAVVGAIGLAASPGAAAAYCLKSVCGDRVGTRCVPAEPADCGEVVTWRGGEVTYAVAEDRDDLARRAFAAWTNVDCGYGRRPSLVTHRREVGARATIAFTDAWASADIGQLGVTRLRLRTPAEITAGSVVFHAPSFAAYHAGPEVTAIAIHEIGHLLGLAHSNDGGSIMTAEVHDDVGFHTQVTADDTRAICAAYPPRSSSRRSWWWGAIVLAGLAGMLACYARSQRSNT